MSANPVIVSALAVIGGWLARHGSVQLRCRGAVFEIGASAGAYQAVGLGNCAIEALCELADGNGPRPGPGAGLLDPADRVIAEIAWPVVHRWVEMYDVTITRDGENPAAVVALAGHPQNPAAEGRGPTVTAALAALRYSLQDYETC